MIKPYELLNGITVINTTPHELHLQLCGENSHCDFPGEHCLECHECQLEVVPPCGILLNAEIKEELVERRENGAVIYQTSWVPTQTGLEFIEYIEKHYSDAIILGSAIAAQAYPGRVFYCRPVKGLERHRVKRMRGDAFNRY